MPGGSWFGSNPHETALPSLGQHGAGAGADSRSAAPQGNNVASLARTNARSSNGRRAVKVLRYRQREAGRSPQARGSRGSGGFPPAGLYAGRRCGGSSPRYGRVGWLTNQQRRRQLAGVLVRFA